MDQLFPLLVLGSIACGTIGKTNSESNDQITFTLQFC